MSTLTLPARSTPIGAAAPSSQKRNGKFRNTIPRRAIGAAKTLAILWRFLTEKPKTSVPSVPIPVRPLTAADLAAAPDASLFRLGHSTLLLKLDGHLWLTDPVFSERASPVPWAGPKRFHPTPIDIDELPEIQGVLLSHDHFDHLDRASILRLAPKVGVFVAPLGVGDRLVAWGVDPAKVRQLDWWQQTSVEGVQLVAVPSRHFSGRGLTDGDSTLWTSWVVLAGGLRLFFGGDSGYHAAFEMIGERFGPFDLTFLESGAYDTQWPDIHMQPEETLQAHLDLGGRCLVPIHNGTFDLAMHPWYEPFDRLLALADAHGVTLATPAMGERLSLREPRAEGRWWQGLKG